jgi:hypothetical protein
VLVRAFVVAVCVSLCDTHVHTHVHTAAAKVLKGAVGCDGRVSGDVSLRTTSLVLPWYRYGRAYAMSVKTMRERRRRSLRLFVFNDRIGETRL